MKEVSEFKRQKLTKIASVRISEEQHSFLKKNDINLNRFVRHSIDELMKHDEKQKEGD